MMPANVPKVAKALSLMIHIPIPIDGPSSANQQAI
jgi:hypothetical protein